MRIALTVEALSPHLTGIGRYSWELSRRLGNIADIEQLRFFRNGRWIDDPGACLLTSPSLDRQGPVERRFRGWLTRRASRDWLFHGPNYFLPPTAERGIITVHDLSVLRFPETHPADRVRQFEKHLQRSIARAQHIITDTRTVRNEVIAEFGLPGDRVTAIHLGIGGEFRPRSHEELAPALAELSLQPGCYGLCVSTLEPRKKIGELVAAWRALPPPIAKRWPLVLSGGLGWLSDDILAAIQEGEAEDVIRYLGFVDAAKLPLLYAGARLFVYPSIYEGFGFPPLEAMASGVPVIVANTSCLPEISAGAAMLIDPFDQESWPTAIEQGLTDDLWRSQAIADGLTLRSQYDWDRCAAATAAVYRTAIAP